MANEYTPTVWRTGDIITAEKLNKNEEGIAEAPVPTGKITITENGEDIDVSEYALADVNVSGSASDFSTAEVQFAGASVSVTQLEFADGGIAIIDANDDMLILGYGVDVGTYDVVLYKNTAQFWTRIAPTVTSGSASVVADGKMYLVTITGDCVLTIPEIS